MSVDLTPEVVEPRLATRWLGKPYVYAAETDSTNTLVDRLAREGGSHGTVALADAQTQGRGRLQRQWHSPPGKNLYLSVLLRPDWDVHRGPPISLAAGVALAEAVQEMLEEAPQLKWPNDVLHSGRKLAGILVEAASQGPQLKYIVLGLGVNVNQTEFPAPLADTATSLQLTTGQPLDRGEVLAALLGRLEVWIDRLQHQADAVIPRWESFAPWLGQRVNVTNGGTTVTGTALSLSPGGALRLRDDDGAVHEILAGDASPTAMETTGVAAGR